MIKLKSTLVKKYVLLLAAIICLIALGFFLGNKVIDKDALLLRETEKLAKPIAEVEINKNFNLPIKELEDKKDEFKSTLISAKLLKLITHEGTPIKADSKEVFLIISIEYQNNSSYTVNVTSKDFIRLVDAEEKKYSPDFYNDPIEISPISVKKDEVGFSVPVEQKQFKLILGPILEEGKETIEINF